MIVVKKCEDNLWGLTWYYAEATKLGKRVTGVTREQVLYNLRALIRNAIRK
jgi:hypothetical protein